MGKRCCYNAVPCFSCVFSVTCFCFQFLPWFILELGMLSGVAAILRFPMPDLEAEDLEDDSSDSDS